MSWRLAKSLERLREQVNAAVPNRNKAWDGTIGDAAHSARSSDHNPLQGVVHAMDITHDPAHGLDSEQLAEAIRISDDPRVAYIISNRKIANRSIANGAWRPYKGSNPHDHHVHISVVHTALRDDVRDWTLPKFQRDLTQPAVSSFPPLIRRGAGDTAPVKELKASLVKLVNSEGGYGELTEALVKAYQKQKGLTIDGVVGPQVWTELRKGERT